MTTYNPDRWMIIVIDSPEHSKIYKIWATWFGGYLHGDSWRASSGFEPGASFVTFNRETECFEVQNNSGSKYILRSDEGSYGTSMYTAGVLSSFSAQIREENDGPTLTVLDYDEAITLLRKG